MEIREAIEAAMEHHDDEGNVVDSTPVPVETSSEATQVPERGEQSVTAPAAEERPKEVTKTVKPTASKSSSTQVPEKGSTETVLPPIKGQTTKTDIPKAPSSWSPLAREKWSALPLEVQQEAARVDKEVRAAMQNAAEAKKFDQKFKETIAPYEGLIRSSGSEPLSAIGSLLQTVAALRMGSPSQKAQLLANLVKNNGVDVGLLDQALAGQPVSGQENQGQIRDPRFDAFLAQLEQHKNANLAQTRSQTVSEVQQFAASHEFLEELVDGDQAQPGSIRDLMAGFIQVDAEVGANRSRMGLPHSPLTIEQAYERACRMHPEVSRIVEQRERAKQAEAAKPQTYRTRMASSSVRSEPSGPQAQKNGRLSLRDQLSQNYDLMTGGG